MIRRYTIKPWTSSSYLKVPDKKGSWVRYSSHLRELRAKDKEIKRINEMYKKMADKLADVLVDLANNRRSLLGLQEEIMACLKK